MPKVKLQLHVLLTELYVLFEDLDQKTKQPFKVA